VSVPSFKGFENIRWDVSEGLGFLLDFSRMRLGQIVSDCGQDFAPEICVSTTKPVNGYVSSKVLLSHSFA